MSLWYPKGRECQRVGNFGCPYYKTFVVNNLPPLVEEKDVSKAIYQNVQKALESHETLIRCELPGCIYENQRPRFPEANPDLVQILAQEEIAQFLA